MHNQQHQRYLPFNGTLAMVSNWQMWNIFLVDENILFYRISCIFTHQFFLNSPKFKNRSENHANPLSLLTFCFSLINLRGLCAYEVPFVEQSYLLQNVRFLNVKKKRKCIHEVTYIFSSFYNHVSWQHGACNILAELSMMFSKSERVAASTDCCELARSTCVLGIYLAAWCFGCNTPASSLFFLCTCCFNTC